MKDDFIKEVTDLNLYEILVRQRKSELDRMAAMLSQLGGRGYCVEQELKYYASTKFDPDSDSDLEQIHRGAGPIELDICSQEY